MPALAGPVDGAEDDPKREVVQRLLDGHRREQRAGPRHERVEAGDTRHGGDREVAAELGARPHAGPAPADEQQAQQRNAGRERREPDRNAAVQFVSGSQ